MGSWSTSAPSLPAGSGWSAEQNTGKRSDTYNEGYAKVSVARGSGDTVYVRYKIYIKNKYSSDAQYQGFPIKCRIKISGTTETSSQQYDSTPHPYGTEKLVATVYYTGSASPGTSIECRIVQGSESTKTTLTAPDLITFAVTYDGNGADGGSTEAQAKVYGVDLTLAQNGFTRNGWAFTGWNTAADGSGTDYAAGGTYSADAALALYAQWEQTELPVYVNVDGTVKRIAEAYMNVGGAMKECGIYMNVNGEIKELV